MNIPIKFINNKILIKTAGDLPGVPNTPVMKSPEVLTPDLSDDTMHVGKHSFQGTLHHGKKSEFGPHENIMDTLKPVGADGIPQGSTHINSIKPNHGPMFNNIMNDITKQGGNPMVVGGYPRDWLLGKDSKDKDIEVYGMPSDKLAETLAPHGNVNTVGSSFGVTKLATPDGQDYDFSLPRRENKEGQGHKGFQVQPDPTMTPKEAASRRDFTFNSIMQHPQTGEIHDYYGGLNDLKNKTLRATSDKFAEDPLRVLRGMQFAGRMGMDMDPDTAQMSKGLSKEYPTLSKDRIMTEWSKLAEKSHTPSKGLKVLQDTDWIQHYPELQLTPDKMKTIDHMAGKLQSDKAFSPEDKNALFFSALTHDMPKDNAASFLDRIGMPGPVRKRVMSLKNGIDSPHVNGNGNESDARNLSHAIAPESMDNLMHILEAKHGGVQENHKTLHDTAKGLNVHQKPPAPLVNGQTLMQAGIKPGKQMGQLLDEVFQAQLDGKVSTPEEAMKYIHNLANTQNKQQTAAKNNSLLAKTGIRGLIR